MPGIPINLTKTPGRVHGPAPEAGADNGKIKVRPAPARPGKTPVLRPGPLAGYRILDMGTFVAGPYCGSLLSELGADVIKVEPLTGDPFRATGFTYNRGMRSVGMDLQNKDGRDAFYEMVKISDVVIDSLRPGVTKKLGIDFEKLNALKNGMVTVSMSAYGEGGPLSHLPGVDMVLQAMSGMMTSQAGDDDPVANTIAIIDVSTAAMCALAGILGIYHREMTGEGQRIWNSLAATATYLQSEELVRYQGRPALVKGSENHRGPNWLDRFYKTKDGWIRLQAAAPDKVSKETLAKAGIKLNGANDKIQAMAEVLEPLESADAIQRLAGAGIAAVRTRRVSETMRDPELLKEEFVHLRAAADGTFFTAPGRFATYSRTQRSGPMRVSGIGEHSVEVLTSAGLKPEKIQALGESGAITIGKPVPQQLMPSYR